MSSHAAENARHLYLLALEVAPLSVGKMYNPLPSHLTLMHRFWSELSPEELARTVEPALLHTRPLELIFGKTRLNGPQKARVNTIQLTTSLQDLHMRLFKVLNTLAVTYTAPQWVGTGFGPHVTQRPGVSFAVGYRQIANAAYLIEVEIQGENHRRFIRAKFELAAQA